MTNTMVALHNAYGCKDEIKAAGGMFDPARKAWLVTAEQLAALDARITPSYSRSLARVWGAVRREPLVRVEVSL